MFTITFPTRSGYNDGRSVPFGSPEEAVACRCMDQLVLEPDRCFTCGRLLVETIRKTFRDQALRQRHQNARIAPWQPSRSQETLRVGFSAREALERAVVA